MLYLYWHGVFHHINQWKSFVKSNPVFVLDHKFTNSKGDKLIWAMGDIYTFDLGVVYICWHNLHDHLHCSLNTLFFKYKYNVLQIYFKRQKNILLCMRLTTLRKNQSFTIASPSYLPILLYLNVWSFEMIVLDCLHKHIYWQYAFFCW